MSEKGLWDHINAVLDKTRNLIGHAHSRVQRPVIAEALTAVVDLERHIDWLQQTNQYPQLQSATEQARHINARKLIQACKDYARAHGERWPDLADAPEIARAAEAMQIVEGQVPRIS